MGKYKVKKEIKWEGTHHPLLKSGDTYGLEVQGPKSSFGLTRYGNSNTYSRFEEGKKMGGKRFWTYKNGELF